MSSNFTFTAIRQRQAVRRFSSKPVPDALLYEVLDLANRAPSGFNLQPWRFIVVVDHEVKRLLHHIALDQMQVAEAPAVVVFVADPDCWKKPYSEILENSVEAGVMSEQYSDHLRRTVNMIFRQGPFGISGFMKRIVQPIRRLGKPVPRVITSRSNLVEYVRQHTMLAVGTFLIAAESAGLATCPMEGFDEDRLKKLLAVPSRMTVPAIVATGYMVEGDATPYSFRTPLDDKLSVDLFPNTLSKLKDKELK